jgi:uncharacterized membrane protein
MINMVLLSYTTWIKYHPQAADCPSCAASTNFLPVPDVYIALTGAIVCAALSVLLVLAKNHKRLYYLSVILASVSAFTASFLQAVQFSTPRAFCYYCFAAAILFYLIFIALIYETVITALLRRNSAISTPKK